MGLFSFFRLSNDFQTFQRARWMTIGLFELLCIRMQRILWMPRSRGMTQQTLLDRKSPCLKLLNHLPKTKMVNTVASEIRRSPIYTVGSLERVEKNASGISDSHAIPRDNREDNTNSLNSVDWGGLSCEQVKWKEMTARVNSLYRTGGNRSKRRNCVLRVTCDELDAYKRRWNLRVSGIQEQRGEDVRKILIDLSAKFLLR